MMNHTLDISVRKSADSARIWYVLLMVFSVFGIILADSRFYAPGDAAATVGKILAEERLFRLGIAGFMVGQVCFIFVGLALFGLFKSTDKNQARSMLALVIASVPIAFLNILGKFAPLILMGDRPFLNAFEPAQLQALAMLFIELQRIGALIAEVFWGLWLFPLGILVIKSGYFPKFLGVFLLIGGAGYVAGSFTAFVFPGVSPAVSPIANALCMGELPFVLWIIILGVRNPAGKAGSVEPV